LVVVFRTIGARHTIQQCLVYLWKGLPTQVCLVGVECNVPHSIHLQNLTSAKTAWNQKPNRSNGNRRVALGDGKCEHNVAAVTKCPVAQCYPTVPTATNWSRIPCSFHLFDARFCWCVNTAARQTTPAKQPCNKRSCGQPRCGLCSFDHMHDPHCLVATLQCGSDDFCVAWSCG
jgi:hypothetical protein